MNINIKGKGFWAGALALLIITALVVGVLALGSWAVACLLNVALGQLGLGSITTWGGLCIIVACNIIHWILKSNE